jgi:hypothetical protein
MHTTMINLTHNTKMTVRYNLIYKGESMCVCVCVGPAGPKIWVLISPGLRTKLGGDPKCRPPGVPPIVTLSEIP